MQIELKLDDDNSAIIKSALWDLNKPITEDLMGTLIVIFKPNNVTYRYQLVPLNTMKEFIVSDSYGKFFCKNIKDKFAYTKETE